MTLTRRLAAGLPAAGVIAFAALAFTGTPALATGDGSTRAGQPVVMATPCSADARNKCASSAASDGYGGGQAADDDGDIPNDNATAGGNDDTRGNPGYGGESPSPSPSETTPTGTTDTVPPGGGESPGTVSPSNTPGGGVSAGGTLPLTGAPMGATLGLGGLMVAAGAAAVWYTRRRRSA
jgi:LPXTG-motif cell wall-anchored protein